MRLSAGVVDRVLCSYQSRQICYRCDQLTTCALNFPLSAFKNSQNLVVETSQLLLLGCETKAGNICSKLHVITGNVRMWFASPQLISCISRKHQPYLCVYQDRI